MARSFDVVVFDWYATLAAPHGSDWWRELYTMLEESGADIPPEALAAWASPPIAHPHVSVDEATYREYERDQLAELFAQSKLDSETQKAMLAKILPMRDEEMIGIFPDVVDLLTDLRAAGVTVGLCSNWSWDLERHLEFNSVDQLFDLVVCSAIVGYRKPHPSIFEVLLGELNVPLERIAFIGDDWGADIEGATAAGLQAIHLARAECTVEVHGSVPCVADLVELRPYLLGAGAD